MRLRKSKEHWEAYAPRAIPARGHLTKTGKTRKMWVAHWFVYEQTEDGENRKHKEKVFSPCAELTKSAAQAILDKLIRETSTAVLSQKQLQEITVAEFGGRYREMKQPGWSPHWRSVMKSLFENQINPQLGSLRMLDVRREGFWDAALIEQPAQDSSLPSSSLNRSGTAREGADFHKLTDGRGDRDRTCDPQLRRLMLYPTELRPRVKCSCVFGSAPAS